MPQHFGTGCNDLKSAYLIHELQDPTVQLGSVNFLRPPPQFWAYMVPMAMCQEAIRLKKIPVSHSCQSVSHKAKIVNTVYSTVPASCSSSCHQQIKCRGQNSTLIKVTMLHRPQFALFALLLNSCQGINYSQECLKMAVTCYNECKQL